MAKQLVVMDSVAKLGPDSFQVS